MLRTIARVVACLFLVAYHANAAAPPLRLLFLGDSGAHRPAQRFRQLQPVLSSRGIELVYTEKLTDLNRDYLADFNGLVIFANHTRIEPAQEQALLEFVAAGHGFIPLHCASYCFHNSDAYIALVGAQFQRHGTGVFRVEQSAVQHPILDGFQSFESWDETYQHHRHNEADRIVLERRVSEGTSTGFSGDQGRRPGNAGENAAGEPWTWVRTHGEGRVFYTAWGHDDRTWSHPGFQNLVERGIRWACQDDPAKAGPYRDRPEMTPLDPTAKSFETTAGRLPNYPAGERWGTNGEPINTMQKPLDPAESVKHMSTPVGFKPELFAAEPAIGKPLAVNWDERGRLWILETVDYPNELQPAGEGRDRIRVCEDTDGDGQADRFTIFADKLSIPTSLAFAYGGVIVHQAPHTLFLRDNTGDDVADQRDILFTGWSTRDTHAGPSNLNYGLDGWYYGIVGYAGFDGEIAGERQKFQTGFYRFKLDPPAGTNEPPRVAKFEFLRNTNNNSWGVGLNEVGILFGSTANGNPSEYMPIANRYYERVRGWSSLVLPGIALDNWFDPITKNVRQVDWHGGFTAGAGHALYTARNYPREYWNQTAFVAEPTGHLVATFRLRPVGAGFRSQNSWNLVASNDEWTAPIAAEVGPDGNVWFIDWYNIVVQHNPTPVGFETGKGAAYETELRDKTHGRIYRLTHDQAAAQLASFGKGRTEPLNLGGADARKLVQALSHTNFFWRRHAQRLLIERGDAAIAPELETLVRNSRPDDAEPNAPAAMHALWAYASLTDSGAGNRSLAVADLLKSPSPGLRRNAILALEPSAEQLVAAGVLADDDAQVRLAALLRLADLEPSSTAANQSLMALADPAVVQDRWLVDAATSAAAVHGGPLVQALSANEQGRALPQEALERLAIVGEHLARSGDDAAVRALIPAMASENSTAANAIAAGVARAWPRDKKLPLSQDEEQQLASLFANGTPAVRTALLRFATRIGSARLNEYARELTAGIVSKIRDQSLGDRERMAAARDLIELRKQDAEAATQLLDELTPALPPELARGLLEAVGLSEAAESFEELARRLAAFTPSQRAVAVRVLLSRTDGARAYLDAVERGDVTLSELALDQKQALLDNPNRGLSRRAERLLSRTGGLPNPDRQRVIDELKSVAHTTGNAVAGKEVFKQQCAKCHMHSGEGNRIGPDLTGMAVHPKEELLVHILDPSRSVEGNYRSYTVATADGLVLTGLLASETRTSLEFFDSEGKRRTVQREDVDQFVASTKSLMPEGFEKQVSREALTDLLEFLTQRGQYLPLPLEKVATAVSTRGMFNREDADPERLIFADWSPKTHRGVPFVLVDPNGDRQRNVILLNGPSGRVSAAMPKSVKVPCNSSARSVHLLSGVSGWGSPFGESGTVSMIVRLHYADGSTEDHELKNGEHFADYIRRVDVPGSQFAFSLRNQQIRYLAVQPSRPDVIREIEFVKGPDRTAPVIMAVTVEAR